MATDLYADFINQYSNVAAKLKKRFLRKPNLQEVLEEFLVLANQCMESEQPAIAGQTFVMAAKCQNMMGDALGEAECLTSAARQFMKEEQKLSSLKCFTPGRENVESAIGCYMQAVTRYPEDSPLRVSLYVELASALEELRVLNEAVSLYEQVIDMLPDRSTIRVRYMVKIMNIYIQMGNHESALEICSKLYELDEKFKTQAIEREAIISGIFLVLLVEPPEATIPQRLKEIFENQDKSGSDFKTNVLEPDLIINIESMLMSYRTKEVIALARIASGCHHSLTLVQRDLFEKLVRKVEKNII